ncbi:hypothetical protein MLD38_017491 [Melastoma candidum]|uniref:Uncharacterized protein n=1 Tax=Melastoma candidum TaxID=119954 RepID=A0ACB9QSQ1_9MYRT|nr:hypothetical protein MLD38_017491 [Melastoma candidum]
MEEGGAYVGWVEETTAVPPKGSRREVRFFLQRRRDGGKELAVVGRERSLRHMSYYLLFDRGHLLSCSPPIGGFKSRREVVDWLNSVVSGRSSLQSHGYLDTSSSGSEGAQFLAPGSKDIVSTKLGGCPMEEIAWLGSPSIDRKKRKHFPSFCRKGVKISVHNFVYILAEEGKRLVAYLEDMYEDSRGNKVVVVQWFHKADEVGIGMSDSFSDREIFFSLCLQDLSIECIDGLATVLCPKHFEKYRDEGRSYPREIFVCRNLFEEDNIRPFDITEVEGYSRQELVRCMYPFTIPKPVPKNDQQNPDDGFSLRPRKKQREHKEDIPTQLQSVKECSGTENKLRPQSLYLASGSEVEVFSQDSGVRGCWFRAMIIKIHKDKAMVRYQDIQDPVDEANKLEEWVLISRIADPDKYGIYSRSRKMVRPAPEICSSKSPQSFDVAMVVDALWHDGWWEGIVVRREGEDKFRVYFPGEKRDELFSCENLRHAQEWMENRWSPVRDRMDLVSVILPLMDLKQDQEERPCQKEDPFAVECNNHPRNIHPQDNLGLSLTSDEAEGLCGSRDLSKDDLLAQLKWMASRKRSRSSGSSTQKAYCEEDPSSSPESRPSARTKFFIKAPLKVDHENCKFIGDSVFGPPVVPALTSLVMSR